MAIQKTIENLDNLIIREVLQSASGSLSPQKRNKAIRALQSIPRDQTLGKSDVFPNVDTALESLLHGLDNLIEGEYPTLVTNNLTDKNLQKNIYKQAKQATSSHVTRDKRGNLKLNLEPEDMPSRLHGTHEDSAASKKAWQKRQRGQKKQKGGKRGKLTNQQEIPQQQQKKFKETLEQALGTSFIEEDSGDHLNSLVYDGKIKEARKFLGKLDGTSFIEVGLHDKLDNLLAPKGSNYHKRAIRDGTPKRSQWAKITKAVDNLTEKEMIVVLMEDGGYDKVNARNIAKSTKQDLYGWWEVIAGDDWNYNNPDEESGDWEMDQVDDLVNVLLRGSASGFDSSRMDR